MQQQTLPHVITIDGPAGVGKSTLATLLAKRLGFDFLGSGALYRLLGLHALEHGLLDKPAELANYASSLAGSNWLARTAQLAERLAQGDVSDAASRVAANPQLRKLLLGLQRNCARLPGLVAEGRDMGTVVFAQAALKFFVTASPEARARRRCEQLGEQPDELAIARIASEIAERDERDTQRSVAPLRPAEDALLLDTSKQNIEQSLQAMFDAIDAKISL